MSPTATSLIHNGIELIEASQLACWEERFIPQDYDRFQAYWPTLHWKFGRWFCWHAFSVGAESVLKGVYEAKELRPPHFGASHAWMKLGVPKEEHAILDAHIKLLSERRNEGAHEFALGVRDAYFSEVEEKYLPALNTLLDAINYPKE